MLKVGVIGLGEMGKNHVRVYSELPDVELAGIADLDYGLAEGLAQKYNTKCFDNYKELFKQGLDAVSIAVPTSLHKEVAIESARVGINMLVEKPIADTTEAAKEIIKAAQQNNVKLMVGHIERFNPVVPIIKKEIENVSKNLSDFEKIKKFTLLKREFDIKSEELTPTLKIKRNVIEKKYAEIINKMYI